MLDVVTDPVSEALDRAREAFRHADLGADPMFAVALEDGRSWVGVRPDPQRIIGRWRSFHARETGAIRYQWPIDPRYAGRLPPWAGDPHVWVAWRPMEAAALLQKPDLLQRFEERLLTPIVLADALQYLIDVAERDPRCSADARAIRDAAMPKIRRDASSWVQELHAWSDTWALMALARRPSALRALHPFAVAIAEAYAARAERTGAFVLGDRYPFHDAPLVSASAQLAVGLSALGIHPRLVGAVSRQVARWRQADGGFGDAGGPSDILTTFAAMTLLASLDPDTDPMPSAIWLARQQREGGWWRAYGPEAAWLTASIARWLESATRPFADRFMWPHVTLTERDRRTGLPFYGYYTDLHRLFSEIDGLAHASVEVAFIDLAGFGRFNNENGMELGDQVLRHFAQELATVDGSMAIRDGGDEFLVVGRPTGRGLADRLTAFRQRWPDQLRASFSSDLVVAPRILTATTRGDRLVEARTRLGIEIAAVKQAHPTTTPTGIQVAIT